jgi:tetratricopeptide (TPR) repeat protein
VKHDGRNADWWRDLGVSYEAVGGVFARQHKLDQALFAFRKRLEIAQALADRLPDNTRFQRDLSVANNKVADMLLAQGKAEDALSAYRKALAIRQKLAASDPDNATWQRDVAISNNEIGIALTQENKLDEALAAFQQGLAIERKLVAKDRNNTEWQRDLYLSDITIGQTLARQRKLDAALKDFRDGAAVATAELKAHPGDGNWQNMLQYGAEQIGALSYSLVLNREFPLALEAADQAISLSPKTLWFYSNRAHALMFVGRTDEARALYLKNRGQKNVFQQKSWDTVIAEDFAELRKVGLTNPLMDEIAKQLTDGG